MPGRFGELVREARLARGLTLRELARRIGKSPAYLVALEHAEDSPSASEDTLEALAATLDLDRDRLMASAQKTPRDVVPRSSVQIALYRLIQGLPSDKQEELLRQLESDLRRDSCKPAD